MSVKNVNSPYLLTLPRKSRPTSPVLSAKFLCIVLERYFYVDLKDSV
jgi:hypothetical protein